MGRFSVFCDGVLCLLHQEGGVSFQLAMRGFCKSNTSLSSATIVNSATKTESGSLEKNLFIYLRLSLRR